MWTDYLSSLPSPIRIVSISGARSSDLIALLSGPDYNLNLGDICSLHDMEQINDIHPEAARIAGSVKLDLKIVEELRNTLDPLLTAEWSGFTSEELQFRPYSSARVIKSMCAYCPSGDVTKLEPLISSFNAEKLTVFSFQNLDLLSELSISGLQSLSSAQSLLLTESTDELIPELVDEDARILVAYRPTLRMYNYELYCKGKCTIEFSDPIEVVNEQDFSLQSLTSINFESGFCFKWIGASS